MAEVYARLPLSFEANRGQAPDAVRFLSRGEGYTLFLTDDAAVLALKKIGATGQEPRVGSRESEGRIGTDAVLRMKLLGGNPRAAATGTGELPGKVNYFIGSDPRNWRTRVPTYGQVAYRDAYPGVDLVYYGNQGQLEYDFVVAPGADPGAIGLDVTAASGQPGYPANGTRAQQAARLQIDRNGDLRVRIGAGEVRFRKPVAYQLGPAGEKQYIATKYALDGSRSKGQNLKSKIRFRVASYDPGRTLVIDPALTYSTYLGGTGADAALGIAVDSSGNAYITGQTSSTNFPVTTGAEQTANGGGLDVFVTKLNPAGTAQVYSTYIGGNGDDSGAAIAVDSAGDAYVTGNTSSTNFPTTPGVKQPALAGKSGDIDAFVTEIDPGGTSLLYSTYWGGKQKDYGTGIAVDSAGDAFLAGYTESIDFPVTITAFQGSNAGGTEAFFTELGPGGVKPVYSTYLGGAGTDMASGIALDSSDNAYLVGQTTSLNFPVSSTAYQKANGGGSDAFVAEVNPTLSGPTSLVFSTYLGGTGNDYGYGIALDASEDIEVTGSSASSNFPVTSGVYQGALKGTQDAFVAKLNPGGAALSYSTFFGGTTGASSGAAIAVDSDGNALVTGNTQATDFPTQGPALQTACATGTTTPSCDDAFVASLNPTATALNYSTYLGGSLHDAGAAIALDGSTPQNAYVAGATLSTNFPVTAGVFQPACALATPTSACANAFVAKIEPAAPAFEITPVIVPFGAVPVSVTSAAQTIMVTNNTGTPATFSAISASAPFAVDPTGTTCSASAGNSLDVGASCTVAVTFAPSAAGAQTGTLTLTDTASGSPQIVNLAGTGVTSVVSLSPASLNFADQAVGINSAPLQVTLANSGAGPLTISSVSLGGSNPADFSQTNTCGTSVAGGANCTISVSFTPAASGGASATLSVSDNATGSPQTVSLTGTGVSPAVSFSPSTLNFGSQIVGTKSSTPQTVEVTNTGNATLTVNSITVSGTNASEFVLLQQSPCGASIGAGTTCSIPLNFKPQMPGARSATLSIADNAPGSPQTVALSGTGASFSLSTSPSTATVNPGSGATYTVSVTPIGGFNAAVTLTCAGSPTYGTCSISPASVTPNGSAAATAMLTVSTLAPAAVPPAAQRLLPPGGLFEAPRFIKLTWFIWLLAGGLALVAITRSRARRTWAVLAAALVLAALWTSCASGPASGNANNPANNGTPPGTYTVTISGTSSGIGQNATAQIVVN
ncbi:MAG TPA: choice-of-anchor D domain-containing protein [Terriglobia bacterium]